MTMGTMLSVGQNQKGKQLSRGRSLELQIVQQWKIYAPDFQISSDFKHDFGPDFGIQKDSAKFSFIIMSSTRIIKLCTFNFLLWKTILFFSLMS